MSSVLTVLAGLVLAGAATAGVVASQTGGPSGDASQAVNLVDGSTQDPAALYDTGQ